MPLSSRTLANDALSLAFAVAPGGAILAAVDNRLSHRRISFETRHAFLLTLDDGGTAISERDCETLSEVLDDQAGTFVARLRHPATGLLIVQEITLHGPVARLRLQVHNQSPATHLLRDVTLLDTRASEPARQGHASGDLTHGAPGAEQGKRRPDTFDANPLFLGDDLFLGMDWPVAENACHDAAIVCRQFPGQTLAPGEIWISRTCSIGVAAPGAVRAAFLAHLDALRGRSPCRASFYFDWLLHASEGPTEEEVIATLTFFRRLRDDHGVQFDIYALDDGAVETRWKLMWDRYRPMHERLFPHGLVPIAQCAREIGMDLGVWLGPDVVYRGDQQDTQRVRDIQWMVRSWNIRLIKLDTVVSQPLRGDRYYNDWYLTRLAELCAACRAINPELIVINHRIRFSPYMLAVLDSTLWEGAESYPEVFLVNGQTPRLRTRYAAYARTAPTYYGQYSPLLEDHGICFNGDWRGWREEFVLGAFGRALALSPEVYGTLFLLPDAEYAELGRLLQLARTNSALLSHTVYVPADGDFLHSDGTRALRCLVNDSWQTVTRTLRLDRDFGLAGQSGGASRVRFHYPHAVYDALDGVYDVDESLAIPLLPFAVVLVEVERMPAQAISAPGAPPILPQTQHLGTLQPLASTDRAGQEIKVALETTRFAVSSETPEMQALERTGPSRYPEVEACRAYYCQKQRRECTGLCANAWDGDAWTAWSDDPYWRYTSNIWRLDLGAHSPVGRVEVTLSQRQPGPVQRDEATGHGFADPVVIETSADLVTWQRTDATVYWRRTAVGASYPHSFIAEFAGSAPVRYLRILARGFWVQDITVCTPAGEPLPRERWRGNNTLTARAPLAVLTGSVTAPAGAEGQTLAVICDLGAAVTVRPDTEVALAWVTHGDQIMPLVEASPILPSHRWEHYAMAPGNHVVFRLPLTAALVGAPLIVTVALFAPEFVQEGWTTDYTPEVRVLCVPEQPGGKI
jgi:hypothetical protein